MKGKKSNSFRLEDWNIPKSSLSMHTDGQELVKLTLLNSMGSELKCERG